MVVHGDVVGAAAGRIFIFTVRDLIRGLLALVS